MSKLINNSVCADPQALTWCQQLWVLPWFDTSFTLFRIGLIRVSGEALLGTVGGLSEGRVGEWERVSGFSGERRKLWGRRGRMSLWKQFLLTVELEFSDSEFHWTQLEFHVDFLIKKCQISGWHHGTVLRNSIFGNLGYI